MTYLLRDRCSAPAVAISFIQTMSEYCYPLLREFTHTVVAPPPPLFLIIIQFEKVSRIFPASKPRSVESPPAPGAKAANNSNVI